jgi:peptidoglycan/LPS O-acetylase OafA/YrhL
MVYHAGVAQLPGGFIGVDVFFVISGFLITGLLIRELEKYYRIDFIRFYARRIRRLLPAATLVLVVTLTVSWMVLPPLRWRAVGIDALTSALWSGNIRFALSQTDYLTADDAPSPLLHFWSLGVEEQFYLLWPMLLVLSFTLLWRWLTVRKAVATVATITIILSFVTGFAWTGSQQPYAFFLLPSRAWELAAGALLATIYPQTSRLNRKLRVSFGATGIVTLLASAMILDSSVQWPGYFATIPVLATLAVLVTSGAPAKLLSLPPFQAIGRWSYSLYLWHWPTLVLTPIILDRTLTTSEALLTLLASSGLAVASYHWVENPLRSHQIIANPWRGYAFGTVLVVTTSVAAFGLVKAPLPQAPAAGGTYVTSIQTVDSLSYDALLTATETVTGVPANLSPALIEAENDRFSVDLGNCFASNSEDTVPEKGCFFGDLATDRTVALIGDSHSAQWTAPLLQIAKEEGFRLLIMTKSACPPVQLLRSSAKLGSFPECERWNNSVMQRLQVERPAVTLLAGYTGYAIERDLDSYEHRLAAWGATLDTLLPFTRPVLLGDSPYPNHDVPVCLSANMSNPDKCVRTKESMSTSEAGRAAEVDAAQTRSVPVVDTFELICPTRECPVIVGNILVYRDESHISATFAKWLSKPLSDKLRPLISIS